MKKYFGLFILMGLFLGLLSSCSKEAEEEMYDDEMMMLVDQRNNEESDTTITDYPNSIDDYITQNYPDTTIEEVELEDDGTYEVELLDGTELIFDVDGNFLAEDKDDESEDGDEMDEDNYVTDYPTAIDDYVAQNHPDATVEEVELDDDGTFEVELSDGTELIFDADGNFLEEDKDDEDEMDEDNYVTDYPSAIDDYVAQNHPNTTIETVELNDDGSYSVELSDGTELLFDADGNFIG